jgi:hypothetical protein
MLLKKGQDLNGPLSRQQSESMTSYISRRKRWWSASQKLDTQLSMSGTILGSLLLELANLTYMEQQLVMTTTEGTTGLDETEGALFTKFDDRHVRQRCEQQHQ